MVRFWFLLCGSWDIFIVIRERSAARWESFTREDVSVLFLMVCFSSCSWHEVNQRSLFLTSFSDVKTSSKVCVDAESVPDVCLQLLGFRQEWEGPLPRVAIVGRNKRIKKWSHQKTFCSLSSRHLIWSTFRFVMGNLAWVFLRRLFFPNYVVQYVVVFETLHEMSCLLHVDSACFQSLGEDSTGVCKT